MAMTRALSHLPIAKGQEAEALNREIVPYVRELATELESIRAAMAAVSSKLDAAIVLLTEIRARRRR